LAGGAPPRARRRWRQAGSGVCADAVTIGVATFPVLVGWFGLCGGQQVAVEVKALVAARDRLFEPNAGGVWVGRHLLEDDRVEARAGDFEASITQQFAFAFGPCGA